MIAWDLTKLWLLKKYDLVWIFLKISYFRPKIVWLYLKVCLDSQESLSTQPLLAVNLATETADQVNVTDVPISETLPTQTIIEIVTTWFGETLPALTSQTVPGEPVQNDDQNAQATSENVCSRIWNIA